ncbi:putative sulfoacetate transporter SauU [bioreactor metagenome]|uniref:Putative sulfoacetate transporter SauU n=1 Tax=bioreactor metagenome TaxID=1076179 RepID=A0A644YI11_9ZZZZ
MSTKLGRIASSKLILALLFFGWSIANLNRFSINYAILDIAGEFGLNASLNGLIMSSFFVGYAIMQIPGGLLADKFGAKKVLIFSVTLGAVAAVLTGFSWSLPSLIAFRFISGVATGIFFPTASKTIALSFPTDMQGKAMSVLLVAGAIVAAVSSVLFAWIIDTLGWHVLFYLSGACGIFVLALYLPFFNVSPAVNSQTDHQPESTKENRSPLKQIIRVPMVWAMFTSGFCVSMITWGINSWIPTVLVQVRHLELIQAGKSQIIPLICGVIAMLLCGILIDKMSAEKIRITAIVLSFLASASVYIMYSTPKLALFFLFEGIAVACVTAVYVIINNLIMKRFPPEMTGSAIGFVNFGSQSGSFTAPFAIGLFVDANNGSFTVAFMFLALAAVLSALAFIPKRFYKNETASNDSMPVIKH